VIKALAEVPDRHAFVTEYAGSSALMRGVLTTYDDQGLFSLEQLRDPVAFVRRAIGPSGDLAQGIFLPSPQVLAILARHLPLPQALADQRVTLADYYRDLAFYLNTDRAQNPNKYADIEAALRAFDPAKVVVDLRERIVTPLRDAGALFELHPYLTRLYTVLSPEHMTKDPVFSYNTSLPDVPLEHTATGLVRCDSRFTLTTQSGAITDWPSQASFAAPAQPYAALVGVVNDTGPITVEVDNSAMLRPQETEAQGCAAAAHGQRTGADLLAGLLTAAWLYFSRAARSRRS
jgi:hypothetical protein